MIDDWAVNVERSRPRDWCGGISFRDALARDWQPQPGDDPVLLSRAWRQYRLARRLFAAIEAGATSTANVARLADQTYESQRRKLVGDEPLTDRDMALWELLTPSSGDPVGDLAGLFPPGTEDLIGGWQPGDGIPSLVSRPPGYVPWARVSDALGRYLTEVHVDQLSETVGDETFRHYTLRSLVRAGVPNSTLAVDDVLIAVGLPEHTLVGCAGVFGIGARRSHRAAVRAKIGRNVLTLADTAISTRVLVLAGDSASMVAVQGILPTVDVNAPSEVGPFEDLGPGWATSVVAVEDLISAVTESITIRVISVGKRRSIE